MNKKSYIFLFTCNALFLCLVCEVFYLEQNAALSQTAKERKKQFVKLTGISNFNLALQNNSIKTLP
ncbi:MAG TPA: hypothetical protein EYG74_01505 [Sulfurimonas autotrophica]|nr:hypothetical protein [Sulfurimonas autotrophica]